MPATSEWIGEVEHRLAAGDVHSPAWAFRAQAVYMKWLKARIKAGDFCQQMAFALQAYNGGLKRVYQRQKLSHRPDQCFGVTCDINPGIHPANQKEAREYPARIEFIWAARFYQAGWGRTACASL